MLTTFAADEAVLDVEMEAREPFAIERDQLLAECRRDVTRALERRAESAGALSYEPHAHAVVPFLHGEPPCAPRSPHARRDVVARASRGSLRLRIRGSERFGHLLV
jgi:hypothetical protein